MPYIEFEGQARALGPGVLTIGSAPEAGWRIEGRGLDPIHAVLALESGTRAMLTCGAATSAIAVNGSELEGPRMLLALGDRLRLGTAELYYRQLPPHGELRRAFLRDTRRGRLYQLRDHNTIGRHLASSVIVQEPDVSRTHAEILRREDDYLLVPQHATVTSVNGARLLAPALLREGDEITVGRTVLRFTSAPPARSSVSSEPRRDGFGHDARQSQARTMFIGRIEADELRSRDTRRRLHRFIAITVAALAIAGALVTMYSGTRTPATAAATRRHQRAHI